MKEFIIDVEMATQLEELAKHAEKNPFTMDEILDIINGDGTVAGDFDEFTIYLQSEYKLVYSIEQQGIGDVRHLSMSVETEGELPNETIVKAGKDMLGFENAVVGM